MLIVDANEQVVEPYFRNISNKWQQASKMYETIKTQKHDKLT